MQIQYTDIYYWPHISGAFFLPVLYFLTNLTPPIRGKQVLKKHSKNKPGCFVRALKSDEYLKKHYHKPSDNFDTVVLDLGGALQLAEFTRDLIIAVAKAKERPYWIQGSEFSR